MSALRRLLWPALGLVLGGWLLWGCTSAASATPTPVPTQAVASPTLPTATTTPTAVPATATPTPLPPTATPTPAPPTATPTPAEPQAGATRTWPTDGMVQVYVPAGEFIMGSEDIEAKRTEAGGRAYPEIPQHTVYVDAFWIDKYEVTNAQYAKCLDAGVCAPLHLNSSETREHYFDNPEYANYPVIWVSWYMAKTYCEWAGRRLPTEAEWEKAARGTDGRKYPWGNDPIDGTRANFCDRNCPRKPLANYEYDDGYADTAPVGSYPAGASPYGVMDMAGNVWEWTSTIIMPYPYDPNDGRENPDVYAERVWRGGTWSNGTWWLRASVRYRSIPSYWNVNLGFRCASSADTPLPTP